jgi:hypothetical protein
MGDIVITPASNDVNSTAGTLIIRTSDAQAMSLKTSDTDRVYITSAGDVGIGLTNPASKLHVSGAAATIMRLDSNTLTSVAQFQAKANTDGVLIAGMYGPNPVAGTVFGANTSGAAFLGTTTLATVHPTLLAIGTSNTIPIILGTNGIERMRVQSDGYVGIGTTSVGSPLEVYGTSMDPSLTPGGASIFNVNSLGVELAVGRMVSAPFSLWLQGKHASVGGNLAYPIVLNPLGANVGIGTVSPTGVLTVQSNGNQLRLQTASGPGSYFANISSLYDSAHPFSITVANNSATATEFFAIYADGGGANNRSVFPNGNVGIGTTSPIGKLTVQGNIEVNYNSTTADTSVRRSFLTAHATINRGANIGFGLLDGASSAVGMTVYNTAAAAGAFNSQFIAFNTHEGGVNEGERMRITSLGNVGIGTFTPLSLLAVGTAGSTSAANGLTFGGDAQANLYRAAEDTIKTDGSLTVVGGASFGGNVGIGLTNPDLRLHIDAPNAYPAAAGANTSGFLTLRAKTAGASHGMYMGVADASPWGSWIQCGDSVNSAVNYPLLLNPNGGNVGIGLRNPATSLDIAGSLRVTGVGQIGPVGGFGIALFNAGTNTFIGQSYGRASGIQFTDAAGLNTVYIANGGNVGIGVTNPNYKLDVRGNVLIGDNTTNTVRIGSYSSESFILSASAIPLTFYVNGPEKMRIASDGKVGIGTVTPLSLLAVGPAGSTTAASGLTFGGDAQANLYRSAEDVIKTDGSLNVAGLIYNGNNAYYSSVTKAAASNWGQYTILLGNASYSTNLIHVGINGGNIVWQGSFLVSANLSYRPDETWCNSKLLESATYNCSPDDVKLLVLSDTTTAGYGSVALVLKTNGAINAGGGTGAANTITVTVNGPSPSAVSLSNFWAQPYVYQIATSANTKQIYTSENGTVGIGTYFPALGKLESYTSANSITFNYLATNLNNNSPIPVYAFNVTNGIAETKSIKAGIGYERHLTNGRGTLHIYNRATDDTSNMGGTRSSAGDIKVSIANDGNVGINTTVPGAKLDVAGTIRLSANLLSHKTASYTTPYPGISSFGADTTDSSITYYDTGKLVANVEFRGVVWTGKHYIFTDCSNNRAYFYDNNFVQITNAYGYFFVTLPMPSGYANPHGAAWDGRYLWCILYTGAASKIVGYDLDTTNQTATIIAESAAITAIGATYDIEYADGHLYLVFNGTLYIYKWNGSSIDAVSNYPGAAGTISAQAITYDGSYLWVTQNGANIYKVGLDGTPLTTITTFPPNITGWAWNGSNIVAFNYSARNIYIINTTRLRIDTQNLALMGGNVGIGITNPGSKLQVYASAAVNNSKLFMAGDNANSLSYVPSTTAGGWNNASVLGGSALFNSLGSTWLIGTHNGPAMRFGTNNISLTNPIGGIDLYVGSGANIGISNTTPKFALHVNGDVTIPNARYLNFNPGELQGTALNRAIVASYSDDTATAQPKQLGIILHNDSNTNDTFSPALVFGSKSNSSNYSQATAVIAGRRRSLVGDANWHAGELWFWTATSNDAGGLVGVGIPTATPAMVINSTRFVGIGASSPGDKLQVNLNSGENILANIIGNGVSVNNKVSFRLSELGTPVAEFSLVRDGTSYQTKLQTVTTSPLSFGTSGTTKMVIDTVGYVGIGITNPTAKLQVVQSNAGGVAAILLSSDESTIQGPSANTQIRMGSNLVLNGSNILTLGTNNVTRMVIDVTGNVGIGTVAPTAQNNYKFLQVNGQNSAIIEAMVNNVRIGGIDSDSSSLYFGSIGSYPIVFRTAVVEKMRITAAGLVGIGTATPTTLLSVGGAGSTLPASGITFGGDATANLYRSAALTIKTDGSLTVTNTLVVAGGDLGIRILKNGSDSISSNLYIANAANTRAYNFQPNAAGTNLALWTYNSANAWQNSVNFNYNGSVGIGTTAPSGKLHIVSTIAGETVLRTDGTNGTLFSVVDDLSDSLMSVNNSAGLPVFEVFADDRVVAGQYGSGDFVLINNKIGIGTSNPANKLTVIGGASIGSATYNTAAPSNGLIVEGNVGIGTTNPAYKLDVFGSSSADVGRFYNNATSCNFYVGSTANTNGTDIILYTSNGNAQFFKNRSTTSWGGADSLNIYTSNGGIAFHPAGETNAVYFANNGRVGIGITSPLQKLQVDGVVGNPASVGVTQSGIFRISNTTDNAVLDFGIRAGGLGAWIQSTDETSLAANYPLLLNPNGGNVGIGITNPPYKLQVTGGDVSIAGANVLRFGTVAVLNTNNDPQDIYANIRVIRNASTANTDGMFIGYNNGGAGAGHLRFYANGTTERMRIQANDGHVGIGTDTAAGRLDVYNDTNGENLLSVRNNNSGINALSVIVLRRNGNTNGLVMFTNSSNRTADGGVGNSTIRTDTNKLLLGANGTTYHSLETNGNVGIGLTTPSAARLHIKTDNINPALRIEDPTILGPAGGTAGKTFAGWLPIMTGAAVGDKVFIPLFK